MPEGDTIRSAANRIGAALIDREIESIETPHPRHGRDRWPERLSGRKVRAVDSHGKHLLMRFEGGLTVHSHLRMGGAWGVYPRGRRWRRSPSRAWLVIRTSEHDVVQFDGPVLELMTDGRSRFDQRLAQLGPDVLADEFDETAFIRRLREDDQTRTLGDALLDQRNVAGIGNIWKAEGCFTAGVDPWRRLRDVADAEALAVIHGVRPLMQASVENGFPKSSTVKAYKRAGTPCPRCGTFIKARGQGDDNRTTYWCPGCQS
jgi:endonuclease VIII